MKENGTIESSNAVSVSYSNRYQWKYKKNYAHSKGCVLTSSCLW